MAKYGHKSVPLQKRQTAEAYNLKSQAKGIIEQTKQYRDSVQKAFTSIAEIGEVVKLNIENGHLDVAKTQLEALVALAKAGQTR